MEPKGLNRAIKTARKLIQQKDELKQLVTDANKKAKREQANLDQGFLADLKALRELMTAWLKGIYKFSTKTVIYVVAAMIYFINPFDLIPDFIVGLGYADDAAVFAFVLRTIRSEIVRYKKAMEFQEVEVVS